MTSLVIVDDAVGCIDPSKYEIEVWIVTSYPQGGKYLFDLQYLRKFLMFLAFCSASCALYMRGAMGSNVLTIYKRVEFLPWDSLSCLVIDAFIYTSCVRVIK